MSFTTRGGNCILSVSLSSSSGRKSSRKKRSRVPIIMFVGFISYWEFSSYRYIEHFAVHQGLRGRGYGSEILNAFLRSTSKIVLLEIDPVVDSVSRARLRFYRKCGFHENPFAHTHPPYREGYPPHSLVVLTSPRSITENEYRIFSTDLTEVVMQQG